MLPKSAERSLSGGSVCDNTMRAALRNNFSAFTTVFFDEIRCQPSHPRRRKRQAGAVACQLLRQFLHPHVHNEPRITAGKPLDNLRFLFFVSDDVLPARQGNRNRMGRSRYGAAQVFGPPKAGFSVALGLHGHKSSSLAGSRAQSHLLARLQPSCPGDQRFDQFPNVLASRFIGQVPLLIEVVIRGSDHHLRFIKGINVKRHQHLP